jgi:methionyl-tRNA formyltransferase
MDNHILKNRATLEIVSSKLSDAQALAKIIQTFGVHVGVIPSPSLKSSKVLLYKYKTIVSQNFIDQIGSSNIINLHSGKLPEYRGLHALSWMIQNGESLGYLTLHEVEREVDTGAIVSEFNFRIEKNMDINDVQEIVTVALEEWLPQEVVKWFNCEKKQGTRDPHTLFKIYPEKKDDNFFDSKWKLQDAVNLVRAVNPPYGPGAVYQGERGTIRVAVPFSKLSSEYITKNSIGKSKLKLDDGYIEIYKLPMLINKPS